MTRSLGELRLQAMRLLVAALEKKRFAVGARAHKSPRQRGTETPVAVASNDPPRQADRHIPAAEERVIFERDGARCTYVTRPTILRRACERFEYGWPLAALAVPLDGNCPFLPDVSGLGRSSQSGAGATCPPTTRQVPCSRAQTRV